MDLRTVLVLNGPNLNLLGEREPEVYGSATLADVEVLCQQAATASGLVLDFRQSNHEGVLIDWVQEGRAGIAGIVIGHGGQGYAEALAWLAGQHRCARRPAGWMLHRPRCRTQWQAGPSTGDFRVGTRTS